MNAYIIIFNTHRIIIAQFAVFVNTNGEKKKRKSRKIDSSVFFISFGENSNARTGHIRNSAPSANIRGSGIPDTRTHQ